MTPSAYLDRLTVTSCECRLYEPIDTAEKSPLSVLKSQIFYLNASVLAQLFRDPVVLLWLRLRTVEWCVSQR